MNPPGVKNHNRLYPSFCCVIMLLIGMMTTGCTFEKVRPWERGRLANPVMVRDANPAQSLLEQHTYSSKETTSGGYSAGAGGCGCN